MWHYFNITPKLALIAISLIMANQKKMFKNIEVQSSTGLEKVIAKGKPIELVKQIPIILNQYRTLNARVPLDSTGRAVNLIADVKAKTNITITSTNTIIQFHK